MYSTSALEFKPVLFFKNTTNLVEIWDFFTWVLEKRSSFYIMRTNSLMQSISILGEHSNDSCWEGKCFTRVQIQAILQASDYFGIFCRIFNREDWKGEHGLGYARRKSMCECLKLRYSGSPSFFSEIQLFSDIICTCVMRFQCNEELPLLLPDFNPLIL